jgi:hypothetical protein
MGIDNDPRGSREPVLSNFSGDLQAESSKEGALLLERFEGVLCWLHSLRGETKHFLGDFPEEGSSSARLPPTSLQHGYAHHASTICSSHQMGPV